MNTDKRLFALLIISCLVSACSTHTIHLSGITPSELSPHFDTINVAFVPQRSETLNPEAPTYVEGFHINDIEIVKKLVAIFGDDLVITKGVFNKHQYYFDSGLYIPIEKNVERIFAGHCDENFIELAISEKLLSLTLSEWVDTDYQVIFGAKGGIGPRQELSHFTSYDQSISFRLKIEWNPQMESNVLILIDVNHPLLSNCLIREQAIQ